MKVFTDKWAQSQEIIGIIRGVRRTHGSKLIKYHIESQLKGNWMVS